MFAIHKSSNAGTKYAGKEFETLTDAKVYCAGLTEGKAGCTEDDEGWVRYEIMEILPDGNLEQVYATRVVAE